MPKKLIRSPHPEKADLIKKNTKEAKDKAARTAGFKDFEEQVLARTAYNEHPSWRMADGDTIIGDDGSVLKLGAATGNYYSSDAKLFGRKVKGEYFLTEDTNPLTTGEIVDCLRKTNPADVEEILKKYRIKD